MDTIGDRIKLVRKHFGLTQQQLSEELGLARNSVTAYELGIRVPRAQTVMLLEQKRGVSQAWLEEGIGPMFVQKTKAQALSEWAGQLVSKGLRDDFVARLVKVVANLDSSELQTLSRIAHQLVDDNDSGRVE